MPYVSLTMPGHVARGAEAADAERPVRVPCQLGGQVRLVDVPVGVLVDDHDVGDRLAPRQLVAVMLERADEHDRPLVGGDLRAQSVTLVELGREAQAEHRDELVDGRRSSPRP